MQHCTFFWRRLFGLFYDLIIIISLIILGTGFALIINNGQSLTEHLFLFWSWITILISSYFYVSWKKSGQTIGMLAFKLKLENTKLSNSKLIARLCLACLANVIFLSGLLSCFFTQSKQTWYDIILKTKVSKI